MNGQARLRIAMTVKDRVIGTHCGRLLTCAVMLYEPFIDSGNSITVGSLFTAGGCMIEASG